MKNKKILALTTVIALSTTTITFANEIKIVEKNGRDFIPFKTLVKKLGGEIKESKEELKARINSKEVIIQSKSSFAKVEGNYYPLEEKEINGYKIPIDKKPINENKDIYVSSEFLKSTNLLNFDIEDRKLIINNKVEKESALVVKEEPKKEVPQSNSEAKKEESKKEVPQSSSETKKEHQEKPKTAIKPTKPIKPNNNNSNNNSNNNAIGKPDINNNSNNGSSEDSNNKTESNNESNTNVENTNTDNSQNTDSQASKVE